MPFKLRRQVLLSNLQIYKLILLNHFDPSFVSNQMLVETLEAQKNLKQYFTHPPDDLPNDKENWFLREFQNSPGITEAALVLVKKALTKIFGGL